MIKRHIYLSLISLICFNANASADGYIPEEPVVVENTQDYTVMSVPESNQSIVEPASQTLPAAVTPTSSVVPVMRGGGVIVTNTTPNYSAITNSAKDNVKWNQEVQLSTRGYNELRFDESFSQVVFPKEAEIFGQPITVNDNKTLLIRFKPGAKAFTGYVVFDSGNSTQVRFVPKDMPEQVVSIRGGILRNPELVGRPADEWVASIILDMVEGRVPDGFSHTDKKAKRAKLGPVLATPLNILEGGQYLVREYQLTSNSLVQIECPDLYRPGIIACTIETDVVSPQHSPRLITVEMKDE